MSILATPIWVSDSLAVIIEGQRTQEMHKSAEEDRIYDNNFMIPRLPISIRALSLTILQWRAFAQSSARLSAAQISQPGWPPFVARQMHLLSAQGDSR